MTRSEFEERKAYIESRYKGRVRDIQLKKLMRENLKDSIGGILGLFGKSKDGK